jgi:leader peptidase (prepilin peptidase)/N-methyltransferase
MIYIVIFLYGIVIGSFLNVCICRIPEKKGIVGGRSYCDNCNSVIKWYDLIPIVSYIILKGRCRNCKSKISIQHPIIEIMNGLLYVLVFHISGFYSLEKMLISMISCLVVSALLALSVIDFRTNEIPIGFNLFIAIAGVFTVLIAYVMTGREMFIVIEHIMGIFAVSAFLLLIYFASHGRGIGGGDIKLMASAGLVLGWKMIILAFFLGCILASIVHPIRMKVNHQDRVLAFGPYLSIGITVALLFGKQIIGWYLQTFFL